MSLAQLIVELLIALTLAAAMLGLGIMIVAGNALPIPQVWSRALVILGGSFLGALIIIVSTLGILGFILLIASRILGIF